MKNVNEIDNYNAIISKKLPRQHEHGFDPVEPLNENLLPWQKAIVPWALRLGRAALFEECGLGKTIQELEWAHQVVLKTGGKVLILCPLAVTEQHVREGKKFGINVVHVREPEEVGDNSIVITNYERLDKFDTSLFIGIVLDESSCLKDYSSKTTLGIIERFKQTPYRLCGTATPAPNDYEELGNHAEFLGYGTRLEMLSTYFVHDSANTADWRLKKHAKNDFWRWVATWAACISKPSDIGYFDDGYILPPLNVHSIEVEVDESIETNGELFRIPCMSGTEMHKEMRLTCKSRVAKAAELVEDIGDRPCVIWCNTNYEADELVKSIANAIEVRGSDSPDDKEKSLNAFSTGEAMRIITKPSIASRGLNWQHCCNHVFVGLSYSFEDFYQAVRRGYRFGQSQPFNAYVIQASTEGPVRKVILEKMEAHKLMWQEMKIAAASLKLNGHNTTKVNMNLNTKTETGENWTLHHGDCVRAASENIITESVGFSVYSPPFASLYVYSDDPQDMGNAASDEDFIEQYKFCIREVFRATQPGRLTAVHCADLPAQIWKDGYMGLKDFSGKIIQAHEESGWIYHCRVTIWKDPVVEMQRTKALGLLYKQLRKDSTRSRVGSADYLLLFRKPGDNPDPVEHTYENFPVDEWQKDASPVWMDINQTDVLNRDGAREQNDERHICPLQRGVIKRALKLWSNEGDLVYSPFAGIGSEGFCALEMKRKFVGSELKTSYFNQAVAWLKKAERESISQLL